MIHTQSCFIRKNTVDIANKLQSLGWRVEDIKPIDEKNNCIFCSLLNNDLIDDFDKCFTYSADFADRYFLNRKDCIDCGTNEDMFFAIAALDKYTDYKQWFVCDKTLKDEDECFVCKEGDWILCPVMGFNTYTFYGYYINAHKATVDEIIEHFKNV